MSPSHPRPAAPAAPIPVATTTPPAINVSSSAFTDLLMALLVLIWGVNFSVVKAALAQFSPLAFNGCRFLLAASALLVMARWRGASFRLSLHDTLVMAGLGLLYTTFYQIFFIEGIARTTAGNSAMILAASPVMVAVSSHWLHWDRLTGRMWLGVVLAFAGLYGVIAGSGQPLRLSSAGLRGDLLTLMAASLWAVYTLLAQKLVKHFAPLRMAAISTAWGTLPLLLWCLPAMRAQEWTAVKWSGWAGLLFSGLFAIALSYWIWNLGVSRLGSTRTSLYSNLVPVVAVATGVLFLHEPLRLLQVVGALSVIAGIALVRWHK